jgi:hypothetical protein
MNLLHTQLDSQPRPSTPLTANSVYLEFAQREGGKIKPGYLPQPDQNATTDRLQWLEAAPGHRRAGARSDGA